MHHAALMRVFERLHDLLRDGQRVVQRERTQGDLIRQGGTFDERQDQSARVLRIDNSVNGPDVGMVEGSQHLGFALEAGHAFRIAQERSRQNLERDFAFQRDVAGFFVHPSPIPAPARAGRGFRSGRFCRRWRAASG